MSRVAASCHSTKITKIFICISENDDMSNNTLIKTSADELLELVKQEKKLSVEEISKRLHLPLNTVQALVDFLVEEKIFGIEYKFTTPYVYLYSENVKELRSKTKEFEGLVTKDQFYERAKQRKIPYENIEGLWRKYLRQNLIHIRDEFFSKARSKKVKEEKIEDIWERYL